MTSKTHSTRTIQGRKACLGTDLAPLELGQGSWGTCSVCGRPVRTSKDGTMKAHLHVEDMASKPVATRPAPPSAAENKARLLDGLRHRVQFHQDQVRKFERWAPNHVGNPEFEVDFQAARARLEAAQADLEAEES